MNVLIFQNESIFVGFELIEKCIINLAGKMMNIECIMTELLYGYFGIVATIFIFSFLCVVILKPKKATASSTYRYIDI